MIVRKEAELRGKKYAIETGKLAKQANGAVWVQYGDTVILATATASDAPVEGIDFFPLSVEYREKAYAAGKIPGGFFKREGKPSETEVLSARLIDRSIRPLFPKEFKNEVQIIVMVLSSDEYDSDVLGITGASAALTLSDIPFEGPIAGIRVGRINGEFIANPSFDERTESDMDLVIAASEESILMVEGEAKEISEEDMVAALAFGHERIREILELQKGLVAEAGKPKMELPEPVDTEEFEQKIKELAQDKLAEALNITEKEARRQAIHDLRDELIEQLVPEDEPEKEALIKEILHDMEKEYVRRMILDEGRRLDGRGLDEIRPISIEVGVLPRAHGSALFTRGQTQALAATTLGTKMDEQLVEGLSGEFWKNYMLHYNFPPFSTGEVKPIRGTSRREIGHGNLAERAIKPVIPSETKFPYTIRIVSDILESNGSSSMATVCAGSLSLMDAGVPIKSPIAGIAMGLVKEGERVAVLTDILGDEDHLGDMDFKVAGNRQGITAFQMDIKIKGISSEIMQEALQKAKTARLFILDKMEEVIAEPRPEISPYAPRIYTMKIPVDLIGAVIGPGGKTIREITDKTGATINIEDDGTVTIASIDSKASDEAMKMIKALVATPEVGEVYTGRVKKITNFGAFVEILPGKEGLLHISQIDNYRVNRVEDVLKVGDQVQVKILKIDKDGKVDLSRKALLN